MPSASARTPAALFDDLRSAKSGSLFYARVPLSPEDVPSPADVDSLLAAIESAPPKSHIVFNCQLGKGRSTMAQCVALLHLQAKVRPDVECSLVRCRVCSMPCSCACSGLVRCRVCSAAPLSPVPPGAVVAPVARPERLRLRLGLQLLLRCAHVRVGGRGGGGARLPAGAPRRLQPHHAAPPTPAARDRTQGHCGLCRGAVQPVRGPPPRHCGGARQGGRRAHRRHRRAPPAARRCVPVCVAISRVILRFVSSVRSRPVQCGAWRGTMC